MATAEQPKNSWGQVLRPVFWWLLLVLVLYGIHLNQQLLEQTRLYFTVSLNGQPLPYPITVSWDGHPINSGDKISLGSHSFAITGPETGSFTTNLSIWYGRHDLGEIRLMRSMGTLSVKADPAAQSIAISGPEFSTNLQDSSGIDLVVPTDSYNVAAQYRRWSDSQTVSVSENGVSPVTFSPKFGAVNLTCNRDGAKCQIQNASGQTIESDNLPAVVGDLPVGDYQATALYHSRTIQKSVHVEAGVTNDVPFQFVLGAVQLQTTPPGAEVRTADGRYLGSTPLLAEMPPQETRFNLSLGGYEPTSVTLDIAADQTSYYSTNLVGVGYESSMREAKIYLAASNYEAAAQAAGAALNAKPDDADALEIQNEANLVLDAERQQEERLQRPKKWFDSLCLDYPDAPLFSEYELTTSRPAAEMAKAIVNAFTNGLAAFKVTRFNSPESETYEIFAQQIFSLGILGGNERDCLIVVGQAKDNETQILFKIMDFQIQHTIVNFQDQKRFVPISPRTIQMNDFLQAQVQEGLRDIMKRIRQAIKQSADN